jgi:hypothetical protein
MAKKRKSEAKRYPWSRWFSQDSFTLYRGWDYRGDTYLFIQQVRNAACSRRHNVRIRVTRNPDGESFTVEVLERRGVQGCLWETALAS